MACAMTTVQCRTKAQGTISFPVLTYTDALPRTDLHTLDNASQRPAAAAMVGQWDFNQPPTGDGWFRKPSPGPVAATFDFRLTAPPDEAIQPSTPLGNTPTEQHMIGIALGSPSMLNTDEALPPPRFNTTIFESEKHLARKPSKWRKIGGLFKAKSAFTSFSGSAHDGNSNLQSNDKAQPGKQRKSRDRKNSTVEWPRLEIDPLQMPDQWSQNFSLSNSKRPKDSTDTQGLLLSVDIPNVHMDRYSVMFSNVVEQTERPSLLARRAKTLDKLCVPDAHGFLKSPARPVPQRRATSPARTSFSLFPTAHPTKAAQILGTHNFSRGPHPLARANTLPIESPSRLPRNQAQLAPSKDNVASFESPVVPKLLLDHSNTPRSSSSYDKPLPPIRPESQRTPPKKCVPTQETDSYPPNIRPQQSARPHKVAVVNLGAAPRMPPFQPRKDSLPRTQERKAQGLSSMPGTASHQPNMRPEHAKAGTPNRPDLTIETQTRPRPPAKDTPPSSALPNPPSKPDQAQGTIDRVTSPVSASTALTSGLSPSDSTRVPFADGDETAHSAAQDSELSPTPTHPIPKIEVSTARSISVSRAKRQVLIPIGGRIDQLDPEERLVQRKALVPQVIDAERRHRPGVSQQLRIECL